ncbi:hypothetical protein OH77DRAFT_1421521 [Trametes cingulata]|nr:hypothetical protein OH77DRAFT_1421521 [Trametes cingulata]
MEQHQHKFRVNPTKSYSERMTETRSELRQLVKNKLRTPVLPDVVSTTPGTPSLRDVVSRYRVRIEGWPLADVPFKNLSDVTNLPKLEVLLRGWLNGTIYFRAIDEAEFSAMMADPSPWVGPPEGESAGGDAADDA